MLESRSALKTKTDELSAILVKLEHVANDFWRSVDQSTATIFEHEIDQSDPIRAFKDMRDMHTTLKGVSEALQSLTETWKTRASNFSEKMEDFGRHIERLAMNCGLSRLPDELLLLIVAYVAVSPESAITLSHVSRRFRTIMLGSRKLWEFCLFDRWTPEKILTIAERSGSEFLDALITAQDGRLREGSKTILELHAHLHTLMITKLDRSSAEKLRQYFLDGRMQRLQDLSFYQSDRREFIPSLSFPGPCHLPLLRVIHTNVIPHPSLSRNLVRCTISCRPLGDLLKFLSCASMLQHLCVFMSPPFSGQEATSSFGSISLPSLTSLGVCYITSSPAIFVRNLMEKIVPFGAEKLRLFIRDDKIGDIRTYLQGTPTIRELEIYAIGRLRIDLGRLFALIPVHLRTLSLDNWMEPKFISSTLNATRFKSHQLRLLRFKMVRDLTPECVIALRDFLLTFAGKDFLFEFKSCKYMKNGAFRLNDVESAFKDPE